MIAKLIEGGAFAVFAVDPGGTTGYFGAAIEVGPSMKETCATVDRVIAGEVTGDFSRQAEELADLAGEWFASATMEGIIRRDHHLIVMEDFVLRRLRQGGATGDLTSIWVMGAFTALALWEGLVDRDQIAYQQASQAKGYATAERLKLWNLWKPTIKLPHARDAAKHWAVRVGVLVGE